MSNGKVVIEPNTLKALGKVLDAAFDGLRVEIGAQLDALTADILEQVEKPEKPKKPK